ncbi:MAG: polymer-forming cytoskeletal protein [Deltaproteobacteria bacterium]|jgi:cytoskeletal protein CcmA (bactofilin family)|nr:polymer-forming cytoskeletal protein [Deltaproteobacteria bacterium]
MAKDDITAFLGAGTIYNGQLTFVGSVRIDGQFFGEIKSEGTLILGNDARVEGTIQVSQLVLSGNLHGDVIVTGKTIMHKSAKLTGNLTTRSLIMEEGALLQGSICMDPEKTTATRSPGLGMDTADSDLHNVDLQ